MLYKKLSEIYSALERTSKRLEKIAILSDFLREISYEEPGVVYLLSGKIYSVGDEKNLGISSQLVIKAVSKATGVSKEEVVSEWKALGDLGEVSKKLIEKKSQSTLCRANLEVKKILDNLRKLPDLEGKGTVDKKIGLISELLTSASPLEAKYLVRTLLGDLRIGVQENTIRDAISLAFFPESRKESSEKIQKAIDSSNDLAEVFWTAKKYGLDRLAEVSVRAGVPIKVMLAQKIKSIGEGFKALGKPCVAEYKYDGFRLGIHKTKSEIKLFTRRMEDVTKQFPEVVEYVREFVKGESFILDSEAVGYNKETKKYTPFQSISQRIRRKYDIEKLKNEFPVEVNVFDILYYNGRPLIDNKFSERSRILRGIILEKKYKIVASKQIISEDEEEVNEFYVKALEDNQEGIMMKSLDAVYNPGSRVGYMLKLKPEERDLDLVITGAEYGTGKRSGWLTSFILSCKDRDNYLEVGKVSTGLKEKSSEGLSYEEVSEKLKPYIIKETGRAVKIKPKIVVAVTYQEIQKSPTYSSGLALRFPRFTALREDKPLSEINTLEDIEEELKKQRERKG